MEKPNLLLLDYTKPYEVHTDASDFAIGGVLMQERHPITYKNQKLNDTECQYNVQNKDMTWVVHCLRVRRHYLPGSKFLVKTDNVAASNFQTLKRSADVCSKVGKPAKTCLVCQQDKVENQVLGGVLEPLPIPNRPWEGVSVDFISALPASEASRSILMVVNQFLKYGTFISASMNCTAEKAVHLFFKNVVKY
ncbi:hypothetical protein RJ639_047000 [Escallonia herrerae]|uniref:Reverse transcriptase RNase H-like domain-containing protein n=1 Tax=Escallonia herrerae TaxID=1293975 RepID=A0AA88WA18_9ASTE|nr:hypothetical protein RJ639_047000 [Escallonia herrerae]